MAIESIVFLCVVGIGLLAFTIMFFVWQGIYWLAWISGIFWFIFGIWCRQAVDVSFMFMRELGILFLIIGITMFLAPFWIRAKDADLETAPPNDIDLWAGMTDEHRARVDKHKNLKRRRGA